VHGQTVHALFILQALAALWRPLRRDRATDGVSLPFFRQRAHKGFAIVTDKEDELWRGAAPPLRQKISLFSKEHLQIRPFASII
jgi:hypothetical protein